MKREIGEKGKTKILVVFYSMTGNVANLARAVADGAKAAGAEVRLRQVAELIPKEKWNDVMKSVKANLKDIPEVTNDDLVWADGIAFGTPTRFGNMSAQMKLFLDGTGGLWMQGTLIGKVGTVFTSSSTQHGGQETTIVTTWVPLIHQGMIIIGVPYSEQKLMSMELGGGSPYGASSISSPMANKMPTNQDLEIGKTQGKRLVEVATKLRAA